MNTHPSPHRCCNLRSEFLALACLAVAWMPAAFGQASSRPIDTTPARDVRAVDGNRSLKKTDRDFLEKAAKASMSEVAISRVAASRTSNPEVRRFAQMM